MIYLNVVTPLTRPQNLRALAHSMRNWIDDLDLTWIIVVDTSVVKCDVSAEARWGAPGISHVIVASHEGSSVKGDAQRTFAIRMNSNNAAWYYFLDDDNVMPDGFLEKAMPYMRQHDLDGFVVGQRYKGDTIRLMPNWRTARPGLIDTAQMFLRRRIIGDTDWPVDYCSDGIFAQEIFKKNGVFMDVPDIFSYYNYLA